MLKIGTSISTIFNKYLVLHNVFECMQATMEHRECPHETSRCINDVTKRWRLLYWFVWGKCQGALSIIYFYMVECASCAEALNKPIEVFLHAYFMIQVCFSVCHYITPLIAIEIDSL